MIKKSENLFVLDTAQTSYCFKVLPTGHLEHLYYGKRIELIGDADEISQKQRFLAGNLLSYSKDDIQFGLEDICLEFSSYGKGDIREPFVEIVHADGSSTCDFLFESASIKEGKGELNGLPSSYDEENKVEQLEVVLVDRQYDVKLVLTYSVFEECDVITRTAKVINEGEAHIIVKRLMSTQLDYDDNEYTFTNFCGAWAREMSRYDHPCRQGKIVNSSVTGTSSNRNNPFVMISENGATEDHGNCYGINLIYSGNHYEAVEVSSFGKMRLVSGINPQGFSFTLAGGEEFQAPEAVMTFSHEGFNGMSHHMHDFVRNHIVRGEWKKKERPVLLNSWEAAYFDINESKLVRMAKAAKEVGVELFVMDDGWFGNRNDDKTSLGDWTVNTKKLPNGIKGLADKINAQGLQFGIWVEPEMVSEESECYKAHPDWAVQIPGKPHTIGRNQMILDLTREDVQEFIIESMSNVFDSANIAYVKWDMNRIFSDYYSTELGIHRQGEFAHRYVCGLYRVMDELTKKFPHILFEACSAGGNRFDLGMLCYMPQVWASDDTDAIVRAKIQTGYSYGYPMSVIGAHVSGCPNHQTLRNTSIETRFNVAAFGVLGYECNLAELTKEEKDAVKAQIELYKQYRGLLQFGDYYRIKNGENTDYTNGVYQWMTVSPDKKTAMGLFLQGLVIPNSTFGKFRTKGLADDLCYRFTNRELKYNVKEFGDLINTVAPIHIKKDSIMHNTIAKFVKMDGEKEDYTAMGSTLNNAGVKLKQSFGATGYDDQVRFFQDFASRIYIMEAK